MSLMREILGDIDVLEITSLCEYGGNVDARMDKMNYLMME